MEITRQHYLAAVGIDTYMPRLLLSGGPISELCETGLYLYDDGLLDQNSEKNSDQTSSPLTITQPSDLLKSFGERENKRLDAPINVRSAIVDLESVRDKLSPKITISPFSLSVWRPHSNFLVINSREGNSLLPTERLLWNILSALGKPTQLEEEIFHWPALTTKRRHLTFADAKSELQTWLAVEHEKKPVRHLWLMGENSQRFFFSEDQSRSDFTTQLIADLSIDSYLLPSLQDLLQDAGAKSRLFQFLCVQGYDWFDL